MQLRDASLGRYLKKPEQQYSQIDVSETVSEILADISTGGIDAVRRYSRQFDNWDPPSYRVAGTEVREAQSAVEPRLVAQIDFALERIRSFAEAQKDCIQPLEHTAWQGMRLGHRIVPVRSAGCYVPGGVYPLIASALMTIAVAKVAGVERVVACAPAKPGRGVDPVQLTAMARAGADEIYAIGGIQALAAMAYGVEGFGGAVDLLCGAGNAFVAEAKS